MRSLCSSSIPNACALPVSAAGLQSGLGLPLLQEAKPRIGPKVHLHMAAVAHSHHDHLPLVPAADSQPSSSGADLGHHALHLEPQRVAQQQGWET